MDGWETRVNILEATQSVLVNNPKKSSQIEVREADELKERLHI